MPILKIPVTSSDHTQGNLNAPLTLVEYGDYQCPYCRRAHPIVKKLEKRFGKQMKFVFRHFPLSEIHPYAEPAAEVAEFASGYGKFWEMHDLIYENQENLSIPLLFQLAKTLELPTHNLESIIQNKTYHSKISNDFLGGVRSGVNGTPTFFINDQRYNGSIEFENLVDAIDSVFAK